MMPDRRAALEMFNHGVSARDDKELPQHLEQAYSLFSSACIVDPTFAIAHYNTGVANGDMGLVAAAVANYRRMLELPIGPEQGDLDLEYKAKGLCNMGRELYRMGYFDEARAAIEEALSIDPLSPQSLCTLSMIQSIEGDEVGAIASALTAFKLGPELAAIEVQLAFALMMAGRYADGLRHFERRFEYRLKNFLNYPYPKWTGEDGKTLFLVADQGIGDTLSFSRFVPSAAARCKFIHMAVQPELARLFRASFQKLTNINIVPTPPNGFPAADCWSTFVGLPTALGLTNQEIKDAANIAVPPFHIGTKWKSPDRRLHIGVAWAGSPANDIDQHRSFGVTQLLELYRIPGVQLYSLQVGPRAKDIHDAGCAALIWDLAPQIHGEVANTVAIIRELDLVITCESALGHIAGMMGKECWVAYSYRGRDYRIGNGDRDVLWNKNHRVFMQGKDCAWKPVFESMVDELRARMFPFMRRAAE
jgi:tetratricopeptide (TPR) repeat protein